MRDATTVTDAVGESSRYEWPDGSAIVADRHGGWDFGVHRDRFVEARERLDAEAAWLIAADLADMTNVTRGEPAVAHLGATANARIGDGLADLVRPATAVPAVATQAENAIIRIGGGSVADCIRPMTTAADARIADGVVGAIKAARAARIEAEQIRAAAGAATRRLVVAQEEAGAGNARDDVRQFWVAVAAATRRLVAAKEAVDAAASAAGADAARKGKRVTPETIVDAVERLAAYKGVSAHTIGTYAGGSGDFLSRLYAGSDLTTRRGERVVQWLSNNWPTDLEWPTDIARPPPVFDPNDSADKQVNPGHGIKRGKK